VNLLEFVFGARPRALDVIGVPPHSVEWRRIRARPSPPVRARRAEADCVVETGQGGLKARGGKDYIVTHADGARAVVRGDIFDRTYASSDDGSYVKRTDIVLRCFTLDRPAMIETLEGLQRAEAGDWVVQGVAGELWPVPRSKALSKYEPA